jgi:hypothetical protein
MPSIDAEAHVYNSILLFAIGWGLGMKPLCGAFGIAAVFTLLLITGCGAHQTSNNCAALTALNISPPNASLDHNAVGPGNLQQFLAFNGGSPSGCVSIASSLPNVSWSVSDPTDASISNALPQPGVATCINAASAPITVTATLDASQNQGMAVSGTASLTCR